MAQKQTDPTLRTASIIANRMGDTALTYRNKAPNDKTFPAIILGTNQKFVGDISEQDKTMVIEKFSIPETVEEGEDNYYTFKINGVYYCKSQNGDFKLYDKIMVYVPNGDWSRMYFDYDTSYYGNSKYGNNGSNVDVPNVIFAVDEPGGDTTATGDFWFVVDGYTSETQFTDLDTDNIIRIYQYLTDEDTGITAWYKSSLVPTKNAPSHPEIDDYWIRLDNDTNKCTHIYKCTNNVGTVTWHELYPENAEINVTITDETPMKIGDYWVEIDDEETRNIEAIWQYQRDEESLVEEWVLQGNDESGAGVGENVGYHNERFNVYESWGNTITASSWSYDYNTASGAFNTITDSSYSNVRGESNTITGGSYNDVSGSSNTVGGSGNMVGGKSNSVTRDVLSGGYGSKNLVAGEGNTTNKNYNVIGGASNQVLGNSYQICCGYGNIAKSGAGATFGSGNINDTAEALMSGCFGGTTTNGGATHSCRLAIGGGTSDNDRRNIFDVNTYGDVYGNSYNTMGADYAEYFEWADGNPENEDRCGMLVMLDGDKIKLAHGDDILGAVSAAPSVIGNGAELYWQGTYSTDIYGRPVTNGKGERLYSSKFDPGMQYIPRSQRREWDAVGLVGRLIIRDNGICTVGGYCTAVNGIANFTKNKTNVRMLKRIDDVHIEVLIK